VELSPSHSRVGIFHEAELRGVQDRQVASVFMTMMHGTGLEKGVVL
jgi:hypothetical protein